MPKSTLSKENSTELRQIVKRLDAIITILLQLRDISEKEPNVSEKIKILYAAGLRPVEIADILNITLSNVSVQLHRMRSKERKAKS